MIKFALVNKLDAENNHEMLNRSTSRSFDEVLKTEDGEIFIFSFEASDDQDIPEVFSVYPIFDDISMKKLIDDDTVAEHAVYKTNPRDEKGLPVIAPTFEDTQGLTTVWKGYLYTASAGSLNFFDEEVTSQLVLRGGWYEIIDKDKVNVGDYLEFSIIDKNDVLGLFALYGLTVGVDVLELKKFVRTEYVNPNPAGIPDFTAQGASPVTAGLFMRVSYMNTGAEDVRFKITEKYHEI